jgi:hypothetical protein
MTDSKPAIAPIANDQTEKERPFKMLESSVELAEFFKALAAVQAELVPAELDMTNPHFNSAYASLKSIAEVKKVAHKNGFSLVQQVFSVGESYYLRSVLGHQSGQWMSNVFRLIPDKKTMQGLGSAITYARRYGAAALIGVVDEEDNDGNPGKQQQTQQQPKAAGSAPPNKKSPPPTTKPPLKNHADGIKKDPHPPIDHQIAEGLTYLVNLTSKRKIPPEFVKEHILRITGKVQRAETLTLDQLNRLIDEIEKG